MMALVFGVVLWLTVPLVRMRSSDKLAHDDELEHIDSGFCEIRKVSAASFKRWHGKEPVIIHNLTVDWPAQQGRWEPGEFLKRYGEFHVSSDFVNTAVLRDGTKFDSTSLSEGINSSSRQSSSSVWLIQPHHPVAHAIRNSGDYQVPEVLKRVRANGPYVSIGGKGHGGGWNSHDENWLAQIRGRKAWMLLPPEVRRNMVPSELKAEPCKQLINHVTSPRPKMLLCIVHPGETIHLPDRWLHSTCNLNEATLALGYIGSVKNLLPLHEAALDGNLSDTKSMCNSKTGKSLEDFLMKPSHDDGSQALHWAAKAGHLAITKYLVSIKADVNARDRRGTTPLHRASGNGYLSIVQHLLDYHADLSAQDADFNQPLHWASWYSRLPTMEYLLSARADPLAIAKNNEQPTLGAAIEGHLAAVKLLVAHGGSLKAKFEDGAGLLHAAALSGDLALVEWIVGQGAKIKAKDARGERPADWAMSREHQHIVDWLQQHRRRKKKAEL